MERRSFLGWLAGLWACIFVAKASADAGEDSPESAVESKPIRSPLGLKKFWRREGPVIVNDPHGVCPEIKTGDFIWVRRRMSELRAGDEFVCYQSGAHLGLHSQAWVDGGEWAAKGTVESNDGIVDAGEYLDHRCMVTLEAFETKQEWEKFATENLSRTDLRELGLNAKD